MWDEDIFLAMKALKDCRVLLVDDAKANLDILVEGLQGECRLSVARDGETALRIAAVLEPATGRCVLANAGQCRPLLLRAGTLPRWAVPNLGTALGFEPGLAFERTELLLHPGDSLVFYTDGVTEAFNAQEECYGSERLLAEAGALFGQPPPVFAITASDFDLSAETARARGFSGYMLMPLDPELLERELADLQR